MILLVHPFGNANVRAVLAALDGDDRLGKFLTTLGWSTGSPILRALPENQRAEIMRRGYDLPHYKIKTHPAREIVRLVAEKLGLHGLTKHETGWASVDRVWTELDRTASHYLEENRERLNVRGAFVVSNPATVTAKNVLVIDDIFTTGATARSVAQVLLRAGAANVWVATLARARRAFDYRRHSDGVYSHKGLERNQLRERPADEDSTAEFQPASLKDTENQPSF